MTSHLVPALVPIGPERSRLWGVGTVVTTCLTAEESGGAVGITHFAARRGERAPRHIHTREDEIFLIRSGEVTLTAGDRVQTVDGSGSAFLPRGTAHSYVVHSESAEFYVITVPGGFEQFFVHGGYALELGAEAPIGVRWSPQRSRRIAEELGLGLVWGG